MKLSATQLALLKKVSAELSQAGLNSAQLLAMEVYDYSVEMAQNPDPEELEGTPEELHDPIHHIKYTLYLWAEEGNGGDYLDAQTLASIHSNLTGMDLESAVKLFD